MLIHNRHLRHTSETSVPFFRALGESLGQHGRICKLHTESDPGPRPAMLGKWHDKNFGKGESTQMYKDNKEN